MRRQQASATRRPRTPGLPVVREGAAQPRGQAVRVGPEASPEGLGAVIPEGRHGPHVEPVATHVLAVGCDLAPDLSGHAPGIERFPVAMHLAQPAEVVEVPAQRVQRRQVMGVPHRGLGHVRLRHPGREHVARQRLVLGVGHRPERHALPRPPRHRPVRAAEEGRGAQLLRVAVHARAAEAREVLLQLAPHHRRIAASRQVRSTRECDVIREREAAQQRGEPAGPVRHRVLREECDVGPGGQLHQAVACASMRELRARDLLDVRIVPASELARAVGRARVDDEQLDVAGDSLLCAHRREHLAQKRAPVKHGQCDGDNHRRHGPAILGAADGC